MSWAGGAGRGAGVPGSTCWSSMSCGMAPTIWMAIFTTSLGGGMAPAAAPHRRQFRVVPPPPPPLTAGPAAAPRPGATTPAPGRPGPLT